MQVNDEKWTKRFIGLARYISGWSKDESTKVGAVIMTSEGMPVSYGFNGFPMGVNDSIQERLERPLKYKYVSHAERNAIDLAPTHNLSSCSLYATHFPCVECAKSIIQKKIKTVYVDFENSHLNDNDFYSRWGDDVEITMTMFSEAGVELVIVNE